MLIDMHVHTIVSSPCSSIDPVECIERALEAGLDAICVTEHETLEGARVVKEIAGGYPGFKVFVGIEVMSREGHLLVYGYEKDIPGVPPAAQVIKMVESAGGIVIPAHPWRSPFGWCSSVLDKPVEDTEFPSLFKVIEMYNGQQSIEQNQKGEDYCRNFNIPGTGGSDAHWISALGCAVTKFEEDLEDERHLVHALKSGRYSAELRPSYYKEQDKWK